MSYKKIEVSEHPYKEKLKKLDKSAWAREELAAELNKQNPSWQAALIAEIMQNLGIK